MRQRKLSHDEALAEYLVYRKRVRELLDMAQIARDIKQRKYEPRDFLGRGPKRFSDAVGNVIMGLFASLLDPQNHALNIFDVWPVLFPQKRDKISQIWEAVKPHVQLIRDYRNDIACHANKNLRRHAKAYLEYRKRLDEIVGAMQVVSQLAADLMRDEATALPNLRAEADSILERALEPLVSNFRPDQAQDLMAMLKNYFLGARAATDALEAEEFSGDDDWPGGEPKKPASDEDPKESKLSVLGKHGPFEPPVLYLVVAGNTGLHEWQFHQSDVDFFPSIPHGHSRQDHRRKLDVYRGWIYREDRQEGRASLTLLDPSWKGALYLEVGPFGAKQLFMGKCATRVKNPR